MNRLFEFIGGTVLLWIIMPVVKLIYNNVLTPPPVNASPTELSWWHLMPVLCSIAWGIRCLFRFRSDEKKKNRED